MLPLKRICLSKILFQPSSILKSGEKTKRWYHEKCWILVYEGESSFNFDSLFRTSFVLGAFAYNRLRDMVMYEPSNIRWIGRIRCVMNLTFYIKSYIKSVSFRLCFSSYTRLRSFLWFILMFCNVILRFSMLRQVNVIKTSSP